MNQKIEIDGDDGGQGLHAVADPAVVSGPPPASWLPLSVAVAAVVVRCGGRRVVNVPRIEREEG